MGKEDFSANRRPFEGDPIESRAGPLSDGKEKVFNSCTAHWERIGERDAPKSLCRVVEKMDSMLNF